MRKVRQNSVAALRIFAARRYLCIFTAKVPFKLKVNQIMGNVHYLSNSIDSDNEKIELLVSKAAPSADGIPQMGSSIKFHLALLVFGVLGLTACLYAFFFTGSSAEAMGHLGMVRVANSLDNVLSVLAYPVMVLFGLLCAYAVQRLYSHYRRVNNPETYGRKRKV